jgi:hypothetical protein
MARQFGDLAITRAACEEIVGQALRPPYNSATDPPSLYFSVTSAVALHLKNAHNLLVSEFQFGCDSSMLFV